MPYTGSYVLAPSIHSLFYVTMLSWKVTFPEQKKNKDPKVLDLQGWD